ncbi:DUF63 family protein [Halobaculum sp. MBLA0147]|uniref:DUF63 family protein n=1 Tax=Halobaculum sp. MBLA0147 TaxID=3079934 RepID=UPI0035254E25
MATVADRTGLAPATLWVGGVTAVVAALGLGSLLAPETVYDGFLWHYFWGPVQADASSAVCAVRPGSTVEYLYSQSACTAAAEPVAYPGYTLVSEVGYAATLIAALSGVVLLLQRLEIAEHVRFFYAMVPFFFLGGALRVVEDADNAVEAALLPRVVDLLLISPIIYFTLFGITLAVVVAAVLAVRRGLLGEDRDAYERPILAAGSVILAGTLGYLLVFSLDPSSPAVFRPQVIGVMLLGTVLATLGTWYATREWLPWIHRGTGRAGLVVVFAHALDGVANVVGLDYMTALGAGPNLVPKHPVNQFVVDTAGAAWPFLVVKLVAAVFVLWVLDETLFEESPRYAILLLIAVTAVGLGPGTRDMLRATIGV